MLQNVIVFVNIYECEWMTMELPKLINFETSLACLKRFLYIKIKMQSYSVWKNNFFLLAYYLQQILCLFLGINFNVFNECFQTFLYSSNINIPNIYSQTHILDFMEQKYI